jgi:AcrR family transcriptional regulator
LSSENTKLRIIEASIELFNEIGFINVRLQNISDKTIISLGNITYHYKTKDEIINVICASILEEQKALFAAYKVLPLFEDIERFLNSYFIIINKFPFFYQDILELTRAYPHIGDLYRKHFSWQEQQIFFMLEFNISRSVFRNDLDLVFYKTFASQFLWSLDNWMHKELTLDSNDYTYANFSLKAWNQLIPFFTKQGSLEFEQLYELKKLHLYEFPFYN